MRTLSYIASFLTCLLTHAPAASAQAGYTEDFESFVSGPLNGQGGWTQGSAGSADLVSAGQHFFGALSLQFSPPPAATIFSFRERLRSPLLPGDGNGKLFFDCLISGNDRTYDLTLFDTSSLLYVVQLRLLPDGTMTARREVGPGQFIFTPTPGTWSPQVPMRLGLEVFDQSDFVRIYQEGSVIYEGNSIAITNSGPTGADHFAVIEATTPSGSSSTITLDNFEWVPCETPVQYCPSNPNGVNGTPASLSFSGSPSILTNELRYAVFGAAPSSFGFLYYGSQQVQVPLQSGLRCVGGGGMGLFRVAPVHPLSDPGGTFPFISPGGSLFADIDLTQPTFVSGGGAITPGSTWNFQFVYRDGGTQAGTLNTTNAVQISFCP